MLDSIIFVILGSNPLINYKYHATKTEHGTLWMKAVATLTIATLLILDVIMLLSARFIQIPVTQSGPFSMHITNL